ncbi:MAG: hypothetical protein WAM66_03970 [Acidobacteriaceae bacterium]
MTRRKFAISLLSGAGMFVAVYLIDAALAHAGMHAETTHLDDGLLGFIVAALAFVLETQREREVRRQERCAVVIEEMNHHIRNALQIIVARANLSMNDIPELCQVTTAVERIDWALREILPHTAGGPLPTKPQRQQGAGRDLPQNERDPISGGPERPPRPK